LGRIDLVHHVVVEREVGRVRLDDHLAGPRVGQQTFRDIGALRHVDRCVGDVQVGGALGLQEHDRFIESLREPHEHRLPFDHADRIRGVGGPADALRLRVSRPSLLDPVLEHEILLLPIVELVLETGGTQRDRLTEERQVPEVGSFLLQIDVAADPVSRDAREARIELAHAAEILR
jgi:hypothetical protein